jgi:SAM-dependent methyltransferase
MNGIEQYYEDYWQNPETYHDPSTAIRQRLLRQSLTGVPPHSRILDVGCGRGEFCDFFNKLGYEVVGTDLSHAAIRHASLAFPQIEFVAGEVASLVPGQRATFDVVFSSEVIEHLFDVPAYLLAINRLLKPNGILILTTPYHGLLKNVLIDLCGYDRHYDPFGQHIRFFSRRSMTHALATFGFTTTRLTGFGRPWPLWKSMFVVARKQRDAESLRVRTQGRYE